MRIKFIRAFAFIGLLFVVASAIAQPSAVQQIQNTQIQMQMPSPELRVGTNAPEIYVGENEDIGPQRILRINNATRPKSKREWLDGSIDTQVFYSDNANFGGENTRIGSFVFVNTAQVALAPTPFELGPGKFAPSVGFMSQWYNYSSGRMHELDFNAQTAFVNLRYFLGNWQFGVGANYTRILSQDNYEETYREWLPSVSLQRVFPLNDQLALIVGNVVDWHFSHVQSVFGSSDDLNDHLDETIFLTLNWQVTPKLAVQPFYRLQYSFYPNDSADQGKERTDWLNSAGLNVVYTFNRHASLRTFFSYNTKWSDDEYTSHYDEFNGGLGAALNIRF
jgi:hypothetical protein